MLKFFFNQVYDAKANNISSQLFLNHLKNPFLTPRKGPLLSQAKTTYPWLTEDKKGNLNDMPDLFL
jgi:hypothetical protein